MGKITEEQLKQLKVGDVIERLLCGEISTQLYVTEINDGTIHCGPWTFLQSTGNEIDEDLGWDGISKTGSWLSDNVIKGECCENPRGFVGGVCDNCGGTVLEEK
jgi:hypothetical protein